MADKASAAAAAKKAAAVEKSFGLGMDGMHALHDDVEDSTAGTDIDDPTRAAVATPVSAAAASGAGASSGSAPASTKPANTNLAISVEEYEAVLRQRAKRQRPEGSNVMPDKPSSDRSAVDERFAVVETLLAQQSLELQEQKVLNAELIKSLSTRRSKSSEDGSDGEDDETSSELDHLHWQRKGSMKEWFLPAWHTPNGPAVGDSTPVREMKERVVAQFNTCEPLLSMTERKHVIRDYAHPMSTKFCNFIPQGVKLDVKVARSYKQDVLAAIAHEALVMEMPRALVRHTDVLRMLSSLSATIGRDEASTEDIHDAINQIAKVVMHNCVLTAQTQAQWVLMGTGNLTSSSLVKKAGDRELSYDMVMQSNPLFQRMAAQAQAQKELSDTMAKLTKQASGSGAITSHPITSPSIPSRKLIPDGIPSRKSFPDGIPSRKSQHILPVHSTLIPVRVMSVDGKSSASTNASHSGRGRGASRGSSRGRGTSHTPRGGGGGRGRGRGGHGRGGYGGGARAAAAQSST